MAGKKSKKDEAQEPDEDSDKMIFAGSWARERKQQQVNTAYH